MIYSFTLVLDRVPGEEDETALFEAGCDDATIESRDGTGLAHFDRDADGLIRAIVSAVRDVRAAGIGVRSVGADPELVSLRQISERTGRTYESVRLLAAGLRGPGGFPSSLTTSGPAVYRWDRVAGWFRALDGEQVPAQESASHHALELADAFVRASDPRAGVSLEDVRELEQLLLSAA